MILRKLNTRWACRLCILCLGGIIMKLSRNTQNRARQVCIYCLHCWHLFPPTYKLHSHFFYPQVNNAFKFTGENLAALQTNYRKKWTALRICLDFPNATQCFSFLARKAFSILVRHFSSRLPTFLTSRQNSNTFNLPTVALTFRENIPSWGITCFTIIQWRCQYFTIF